MVSGNDFNLLIAVYMMSNRRHGRLYIGVTTRLPKRITQHREGQIPGFTKLHGLDRLVWYERHSTITGAIRRETSLKRYRREWKCNLIERENPYWEDLYPALLKALGYALEDSPR